jgi:hypothetical protein
VVSVELIIITLSGFTKFKIAISLACIKLIKLIII